MSIICPVPSIHTGGVGVEGGWREAAEWHSWYVFKGLKYNLPFGELPTWHHALQVDGGLKWRESCLLLKLASSVLPASFLA